MLDRARGGAADRRRHARGAVRRDDDARRARAFGAPADRAEVPRIAHLVETGEQRPVGRGQLVGVGVLVRLAPREHALVVARAGGLGDVLLELHLDARLRRLAQPGLALDRALGRPELEHLALAAERLAHGPAAVDLLARHLGTSVGPSGPSWTTQPSSAIGRAARRSARQSSPRRARLALLDERPTSAGVPARRRSRARRSRGRASAGRAGSRAATRAGRPAPRAC